MDDTYKGINTRKLQSCGCSKRMKYTTAMTMLMPMPIPMLILCHIIRQADSKVSFKGREKAKIY